MRIFIDSADVAAIHSCWETGMIDGITTNPTLLRKCGRHEHDVYNELKLLGVPDISMEVSGDVNEMVKEGVKLGDLYGKVATVKLPCTREGLEATRQLSKEGYRTNVTLVFCAAQAILAAKAGATYVSPFVGRLDDQSVAGLEVVRSITELYRIHRVPTKVIAASIRTVQRAVRSFYNGADIVTMPPEVFWRLYDHILTDDGMKIFENDLMMRIPPGSG